MRQSKILLSLVAAALMGLTACKQEQLIDKEAPNLATTMISGPCGVEDDYIQVDALPACGESVTFQLVNGNGLNPNVDYLSTAVVPWGSGEVTILNDYPNDPWMKIDLGPIATQWSIRTLQYFSGPCGAIYLNGGLPVTTPDWKNVPISGFQTCMRIFDNAPLPDCGCLAIKVDIFRLGFFGPIPNSDRTLYATSNGTDLSVPYCNGCVPPSVTVTQGTCDGCDSENTVTFVGNDSIDISSCQNIAKARVIYDDCSDDLLVGLGLGGSHRAPAGRTISHVWVKSGCNGPADGRRFDGPFVNPACN